MRHCKQYYYKSCQAAGSIPCIFGDDADACDKFFFEEGHGLRTIWLQEVQKILSAQGFLKVQRDDGPATNDGRETCLWCGGDTQPLDLFVSVSRICPKCKR